MLKVKGKYYPKTPYGPDLRFPKNYEISLDVDSIYESDMPIQQSSDLIMSAIHIQLKVPYSELDNFFSVEEIIANINQSRIDFIIQTINNTDFERHLKNGLNLVNSSNWEDAGNRLGIALEVLFKLLYLKHNKLAPEGPLGSLITNSIKLGIIKEEQFLWKANEARKSSSHNTSRQPDTQDYLVIFTAIERLTLTYF